MLSDNNTEFNYRRFIVKVLLMGMASASAIAVITAVSVPYWYANQGNPLFSFTRLLARFLLWSTHPNKIVHFHCYLYSFHILLLNSRERRWFKGRNALWSIWNT
jgi:hypothetical protein